MAAPRCTQLPHSTVGKAEDDNNSRAGLDSEYYYRSYHGLRRKPGQQGAGSLPQCRQGEGGRPELGGSWGPHPYQQVRTRTRGRLKEYLQVALGLQPPWLAEVEGSSYGFILVPSSPTCHIEKLLIAFYSRTNIVIEIKICKVDFCKATFPVHFKPMSGYFSSYWGSQSNRWVKTKEQILLFFHLVPSLHLVQPLHPGSGRWLRGTLENPWHPLRPHWMGEQAPRYYAGIVTVSVQEQ